MLPRKAFSRLLGQSTDRKITILLGPRQVGKTTLLKVLSEQLSQKNKCLFLDLDIMSNYEKVSTYESLLNILKLNGYEEKQKDFFYLFLDEFQKYPNLARIMKNVYDNLQNVKIYASGSSSMAIKDQIQESLAGRKFIVEIYPLDFEEFLWFRQRKDLADKLANIQKLDGKELSSQLQEFYRLLEEFLTFGGYPEVALKDKKEDKISVLESIFDLYVKKDLADYYDMDKLIKVKKLIEFLAVNNGQKIKYDEISSAVSSTYKEVKAVIRLLEETFIIKEIKPFYTNKNKELVKIPKVYFIDNGVRNFFINNFNSLPLRNDAGFLFEGFVIAELVKTGHESLKFWQDKNKNEVDIIIDRISEQIPVEVKFKQSLKSEDYSGLKIFLTEYPKTKKAYLINLSSQENKDVAQLVLPYNLNRMI